MERTITAPSELPGGLDVDAREAAKRARIAKQKAARERRQKKVLEAGDDRLAVVSGEKSTESLSRTSSKEEVPIVKEVAKSEDELLAELLVAEVTATDPDPDDILADVMAGLDEEVVQEEPKQEVSPKMTKKDDSKEILEEQEEDAVETNEVSTVGAAVELEGEGGGGDMVGGYGEQASAEEIKALAAKQAEERAERKAKLEEKKKKKEEGLRRTKTMPTTGTPKKMEERLKSVAAQPLAVKRPALVSRFKLMNLLPAFWVVVSASLLGWLVTLDGLSDVFSYCPVILLFATAKYLLNLHDINNYLAEAGPAFKGVTSLLGNAKELMPMLSGMRDGGGMPDMDALPQGMGPAEGEGGLGGSIQHAMALWGHAKTLYAALGQASSQFCLFLVVFSIVRLMAAAPAGDGIVHAATGAALQQEL